MNFYNPYFYHIPTVTNSTTGLLSKLNFSSIINGTSKTLNLVNQAIPIIKQVSPVIKNAKTMFNIMNEFKKTDPTNTIEPITSNSITNNVSENNKKFTNNYPTFFI